MFQARVIMHVLARYGHEQHTVLGGFFFFLSFFPTDTLLGV